MILNEILIFFAKVMTSLGGNAWDILFFTGIGVSILFAIFFIVKSRFSYEMRMVRKLLKINNWLNKNKQINTNNLIEFNNLMKKTPKLLRYHWHQYMLNRDNIPSSYLSTYNLVEKPIKTSSYLSNIKSLKSLTFAFAGLFLLFGFAGLATCEFNFISVMRCLATPFFMIFINVVIVIIMQVRQNANLSAFFQYTHYFGRFMDRAVVTMPEYVDFEVLFTTKEIKKGIPVLNEYLEKRARREQEELEKARLNAVEHENFDFSAVGIDGALVLERAIKETETYLNVRNRLLREIDELEGEIGSIKRNYENTQKDFQRKMQVSKENVDRLRKQQEETTNRIESNYIKKQQADEVRKQEQLEKESDSSTVRFNQEMESLTKEIEIRRTDLEEKRQYVEIAMKSEYTTLSNKMYNEINESIKNSHQEEKKALIDSKDEVLKELQEANVEILDKEQKIQELTNILESNNIDVDDFCSDKLQEESLSKRKNKILKQKNKDENEDDSKVKLVEEKQEEKQEEKPITDETQNIATEQQKTDSSDDVVTTEQQEVVSPEEDTTSNKDEGLIPFDQIPESEKEYGEDGGFFDKNNYYRYASGAYFDPQGRYFDELGGWFEEDGTTYHPPEEKLENYEINEKSDKEVDAPLAEEDKINSDLLIDDNLFVSADEDLSNINKKSDGIDKEELDEETKKQMENLKQSFATPDEIFVNESGNPVTVSLDKNGAYYDSVGNYVYPEKGYYDTSGNFHDFEGGWYEKDTMIYHEPSTKRTDKKQTEIEEKVPSKRRVGRPRKEKTENAYDKPKRRVGRPRKEISKDDDKPKRKPGRPRKEINKEEHKLKRKPGRPRKTELTDVIKRKPGRPKKEKSPIKKSTGKRGRPPKNAGLSEIELLNQKIEQENQKLVEHQQQLKTQLDETLNQLKDNETSAKIDDENN